MATPILTQNDIDRFLRHTALNPRTGCVEWLLSRFQSGYGRVKAGGHDYSAHRVAWAVAYGAIPEGANVLHRCDNRVCVDVAAGHLFLGDHAANMADMVAKRRHRNQRITHCPRGHEYTPESTYLHDKTQSRQCKACWPDKGKADYVRHREKRKADAAAYYYRNRDRVLARLRAAWAAKRS